MNLGNPTETLKALGNTVAELDRATVLTAPGLARRAAQLSHQALTAMETELAQMRTRLNHLEGGNHG